MSSTARQSRNPPRFPVRCIPGSGKVLLVVGVLVLLIFDVVRPGTANADSALRLDPSFAGNGVELTKGFIGEGLAEDGKGRLVVVGGTRGGFAIARYLANGDLDHSFGEGGIVHLDLSAATGTGGAESAHAGAVAIQPSDGKIVIGGSFDPNLNVFSDLEAVLARLNPDGSLDTGFGGARNQGGRPGLVLSSGRTEVRAIALQNRRILIGGQGAQAAYIARFNPDGRRDKTFAAGQAGGQVQISAGKNGNGVVSGLLATDTGGIYAAGDLNGNFMLARLSSNGALDHRFGTSGVVKTNVASRRHCGCSLGEGLARDRRGRLLVSGTITAFGRKGSPRAIAIARYEDDGLLDRGFADDGISRTRVGGESSGGNVAVGRGGEIIVAGTSAKAKGASPRFTVVRYRQDGQRDRSFFGDGVFAAAFGAERSRAAQPLIDQAGRVVVLGNGTASDSGASKRGRTILSRFRGGSGGPFLVAVTGPGRNESMGLGPRSWLRQ